MKRLKKVMLPDDEAALRSFLSFLPDDTIVYRTAYLDDGTEYGMTRSIREYGWDGGPLAKGIVRWVMLEVDDED